MLLRPYVVRFELVEYSAGLTFYLVLCWQLYILTGLIPVNTQYEEVFRRSTVAMQILSPNDERIAVSENAAEITPAMLEALKQNQHFSVMEDVIMHLHQIPDGYMVWQTDLSQINQALRELQRLNAELEEEQDCWRRKSASNQMRQAFRRATIFMTAYPRRWPGSLFC